MIQQKNISECIMKYIIMIIIMKYVNEIALKDCFGTWQFNREKKNNPDHDCDNELGQTIKNKTLLYIT